jgi:CheY-like chemotaxis protein
MERLRVPVAGRNILKNVLLVDDSPDDIELATIAIQATGEQVFVDSAPDARTALTSLRDCKLLPSVILLDIKMPGMSGLDMLREMREDSRLKDIPVITVTSSPLETDREKAFAAGANGFLHKSFSMDEFTGNLSIALKSLLPA